jgi:type IV pilus assembly protein PilB
MFRNGRKKFGEYLLEKNRITVAQYGQALDHQNIHKEMKMAEVLCKLHILDRDLVLKELAIYLDQRYIILDKITIPPNLKDLFTYEFLSSNNFVPYELEGNKVKIAIDDINSFQLKSDIDSMAFKKNYLTEYYMTLPDMVKECIAANFMEMVSDSKDVPNLVDFIIEEGIKTNSSDIHIEPINEDTVRIRYRVDGQMVSSKIVIPLNEYEEVVSRIKIMGNLNTTEKRRSQDGHISNFKSRTGRVFDIRISVVLVAHGEKIVLRLLGKSDRIKELKELGFNDSQIAQIYRNINHKNGVIFVTGATGTGKSTTLYTILSILNKISTNIITIENPVERTVEGLNQININESIGISFSSTLRTVLRQDPDIIMVGEIRDKDTLSIALEASMTGHLVLTTLHTNSAVQIIDRVNSMGVDMYNFASSVLLVVSQKLIRKLCPQCRQEYRPSNEELEYMQAALGTKLDEKIRIYRNSDCSKCHQGYLGREVICEVFEKDQAIEKLLVKKASSSEVLSYLNSIDYASIKHHAVQKVIEGLTSLDEVRTIFAD